MPVKAQLAPVAKPIDIEQIIVITPRLQYVKIGNHVQEIDSLTFIRNVSSNLGELLTGRSGIFVKSYGTTGSMSSVSFRGTGATHTALMWNGFPINSVTTGEIDLSLIPVLAANKISVVPGAPSTLFGSGTFGGSIELCSEPEWNNKLNVKYISDIGSFNAYSNSLKIAAANKHVYYSIVGTYQNSDNNFIYQNNNDKVKVNHNRFESSGIIQQLAFKFNSTSELQTSIWYQQKQKQLPLQIGQLGESKEDQADSSLRMFALYKHQLEGISLQAQTGLFYNYLHYTNSNNLPKIDSHIRSRQLMNILQMRITKFDKLILDISAGYTIESAHTQYYGSTISEKEGVFSIAANYPISILTVNASLRKDWMERYSPKPQYSLGIKVPVVYKYIALKGSISTRFRKPTFNERYWMPYGNPNIKPESGWGCESTLDFHFLNNNKISANQSITLYSNSIKDWIQWVPLAGNMTQPRNYKSVWSRGLEVEENIALNFRLFKTAFRAAYYYTRSTIQDTYGTDKYSIGQQLIYVPLHTAQGSYSVAVYNVDAEISANYIGYRYIDEMKNLLHAYLLFDISTGYTLYFNNYSTRLSFKIMNIYNTQYEVINTYAMPGRSFHFSLYFNFKS